MVLPVKPPWVSWAQQEKNPSDEFDLSGTGDGHTVKTSGPGGITTPSNREGSALRVRQDLTVLEETVPEKRVDSTGLQTRQIARALPFDPGKT